MPALLGDFFFDFLQAGFAVRPLADRQQVAAFGVQQEQQAIQQRQRGFVDVVQFVVRRLAAEAHPSPAVFQEALGQMWEDRDEDAVLQPLAQPLGVLAAALGDGVEPAGAVVPALSQGEGSGTG